MAESRGVLIVKANDGSILIQARLTNSAGAIITSGTASLYLAHVVPGSGAFETLDHNDNTFKTGACTTPTVAMTHRTLNNATVNTGVWNYRVTSANLSAHVVGDKYVAYVTHASLVEAIAIEYQYGAGEGDDTPQTQDHAADLTTIKGYTDTLEASLATITTYVDELESRLSSARAGYLDNLNVGGLLASQAEVLSIPNNTRVLRSVPPVIERPDSGTITYRIELLLYDTQGAMEAPDSAPTIALVNQAGTDLSSRLDSATMTLVSTGRYRVIYTASVGDTLEQLNWTFTVVEGGATRLYPNTTLIVDTTAVDFTAADRTKLDTIHDTRLTAARATLLDNLNATISSRAAPADVPSAATVGTAVWATAIENSKTAAQIFRGLWSVFGFTRTSGFQKTGASTPVFRDDANSKNRATVTQNDNGNRTGVSGVDLD